MLSLLADGGAASGLDPSVLLNYGFGGVFVILVLAKQIVPGWIYKKAQTDLDELQDIYKKDVLPALIVSNEVLQKLVVHSTDIRVPPGPER